LISLHSSFSPSKVCDVPRSQCYCNVLGSRKNLFHLLAFKAGIMFCEALVLESAKNYVYYRLHSTNHCFQCIKNQVNAFLHLHALGITDNWSIKILKAMLKSKALRLKVTSIPSRTNLTQVQESLLSI
jgi:hypothetical protein